MPDKAVMTLSLYGGPPKVSVFKEGSVPRPNTSAKATAVVDFR
jgi:hypothetical protein